MRFATITTATAAALVVVSCTTTSVNSDYDHEADFAGYSTFAWYTSDGRDRAPTTGASQIVDGRIRRAVADNLVAKGYSEAATGTADLQVAYYTSLSSQLRVSNAGWGYGWGYGPWWGFGYGFWPGWGATTVSTYNEGTLIVDVIDRGKNQLVWRGVITSALSKKSSSEESIDRTVTRVLADFPVR